MEVHVFRCHVNNFSLPICICGCNISSDVFMLICFNLHVVTLWSLVIEEIKGFQIVLNSELNWIGLLLDTQNCGLCMRRECRERFPRHRLQRKDPGMHHGVCVTHVPWCRSRSLTRGGGENVPGIPDACTSGNIYFPMASQITNFTGPTWGPPGSCRPQVGPMLAMNLCYQGTYRDLSFGMISYIATTCPIMIYISRISSETALKWMSEDLTHDQATLSQVMSW